MTSLTDLALFAGPIAVKVGAVLGTAASMAFATQKLKPLPALISVLVGIVASIYATDIITHVWPSLKEVQEPVSFLCGLFGMNFLGGLFTKFQRFQKAGDFKEFSDVKAIKDIV